MPRTKGSKNKKSLSTSAAISEQIESQQRVISGINSELEAAAASIKHIQSTIKEKKKELRKAEKSLSNLMAKKEEAEAMEVAAAKKAQIENVVSQLISSGKSAEEILAQLQ